MSYTLIDKIIKSDQLNGTDKMVLIAIASFGNEDGGSIFACQTKIAKRAGMHKRTLIRSIKNLVENGFLNIENTFRNNMKTTNKYFVNVFKFGSDKMSHRSDKMSPTVVTKCHIDPTMVNQPLKKQTKKNKNDYTKDFEEFWQQYPKKQGKGGASKAYVKAIKKASHSEIMNGVLQYAAHVQNVESRFIKHPQGWLNDERWLDDYQSQQNKGNVYAKNKGTETFEDKYWRDRAAFCAAEGIDDPMVRGEQAHII